MTDIILHHYPMSPFSELLRVALGHKGLAWKSVIIPNIAPKPELTPLTGGYRKTPVLQIGANIYCDTAIAIEAIEAAHPDPTFFPAPMGRAGAFAALWASGPVFAPSVATAMAKVAGSLPPEFWADRKALFGFDPDRFTTLAPHLQAQFVSTLARIEDALGDGRAFLGGAEAGYGDFALYLNVWFQRLFNPEAPVVRAFANVSAWADRIAKIGHGSPSDMTAQEALAAAKAATPVIGDAVDADTGFTAGQRVTVRTEDPGANPVTGTLARLTARDIAVLREDPLVGAVAVHFPRLGQIVTPA